MIRMLAVLLSLSLAACASPPQGERMVMADLYTGKLFGGFGPAQGAGSGGGLSGLGSTDRAIPVTNGTGGDALQGSSVTIDASGAIHTPDGSQLAPAITGSDTDTGLFFGADVVRVATGAGARLAIDSETATFATRLAIPDGSAAAPAIRGADADTGVFFGTNQVSLSAGGAEYVQCSSAAGGVYLTGKLVYGGLVSVTARTTDLTLSVNTNASGLFTNEGASGEVILSLPSAAAGLTYEVAVEAAQYLQVKAASGDVIRADPNRDGTFSTSADAGYIRSNVAGSTLRIVAINTTTWQVMSETGTWTIDS